MRALDVIDEWPVAAPAAATVRSDGTVASKGAGEHPYALASVTKVLVALTCLVAVEEGSLDLDAPAGPPGSTVRHLLAHASGLAPDDDAVLAAPGTRRIYSNRGFEVLGDVFATATGLALEAYLHEAVVGPLGLRHTRLDGSPASGAVASLDDLAVVGGELLRPTLIARETLRGATSVAYPGLDGVLPGIGAQSPNDWGLGVEIRDAKAPHWTGSRNSPSTFGHFGRSGTMLWVDPVAEVALVSLTETAFGPWALQAWPALSDAVLDGHTGDSWND